MVEQLLFKGSPLNAVDKKGQSALMYAVKYSHLGVVELLLKAGVNIHLRDKHGKTAMMFAAEQEESRIVEAMITREARLMIAQKMEPHR